MDEQKLTSVDASPKPEIDDTTRRKTEEIHEACRWNNVEALGRLAESEGGFLTDELRRKAWPILLGVANKEENENIAGGPDECAWKELPRHGDEDQVQLDVNRSFIYYPNDLTDAELDLRKSELSDLIVSVLRRNPYLHYFQGYHDICQVFLLVLQPLTPRATPTRTRTPSPSAPQPPPPSAPATTASTDASSSPPPPSPAAADLVARLSALRIRDFMLPTLEPTVAQLLLIPDILAAADPALRAHLADTEPFYALAGTLTMYAHDIQAYGAIARLFDVLLAREPAFSVYMFAQIVLSRRVELFENADADDPSMLHLLLSKVPQHMDLERLLADTAALFRRFPPERLRAWRRISAHSCLKTARGGAAAEGTRTQTLEDGRSFFEKHVAELRAAERRRKMVGALWAYRRRAGAVGLAVAVGLIAVYLRRGPPGASSGLWRPLTALWSRWTSGAPWTYTY